MKNKILSNIVLSWIIIIKDFKFMNEKFTSKGIENHNVSPNIENSDYENLIIRLEEISATITSLEKQYLDKF